MNKIDKIKDLKLYGLRDVDIVMTIAAGNEKCDEIQDILNNIKLNPKYSDVFENNILIVSDHSTYANKSSVAGDFGTKTHPYYNPNGGTTSYATPQALCEINQVINSTLGADGKPIKATEALVAIKEALRNNPNGEIDVEEAKAMTKKMYSTAQYVNITGTTWDFSSSSLNGTLTMNFNANNVCTGSNGGASGDNYVRSSFRNSEI